MNQSVSEEEEARSDSTATTPSTAPSPRTERVHLGIAFWLRSLWSWASIAKAYTLTKLAGLGKPLSALLPGRECPGEDIAGRGQDRPIGGELVPADEVLVGPPTHDQRRGSCDGDIQCRGSGNKDLLRFLSDSSCDVMRGITALTSRCLRGAALEPIRCCPPRYLSTTSDHIRARRPHSPARRPRACYLTNRLVEYAVGSCDQIRAPPVGGHVYLCGAGERPAGCLLETFIDITRPCQRYGVIAKRSRRAATSEPRG